jgi:hypothetical protein
LRNMKQPTTAGLKKESTVRITRGWKHVHKKSRPKGRHAAFQGFWSRFFVVLSAMK